jgi:quercetin dioxygenase-like cupin family protein
VGGVLIGPEDGERVSRDHRILAELPELEVVELRFGPDFEGVEPHSHADHVDSFYVLEGEASS